MSTESVLAALDRAVDDWDTSADAMRWQPEPQPEPRTVRMPMRLTLAPADAARLAHYLGQAIGQAQATINEIAAAMSQFRPRFVTGIVAAEPPAPPASARPPVPRPSTTPPFWAQQRLDRR